MQKINSFLKYSLIIIFLSFKVEASVLSDKDESDIINVVKLQLEAFQQDDFETAYSYASPVIKQIFKNADEFKRMVKSGYQAVYRPKSVNFGPVELIDGVPVLIVYLVDPDGIFVTATYTMQKQDNGEWLINGCMLNKAVSDEI